MKKTIFYVALCLLMLSFSSVKAGTTQTQDNPHSIVTADEYKKASEFEKRVINQIDAAVSALNILDKDSSNSVMNDAIISISKNLNNKFSNAIIIISEHESVEKVLQKIHGSCTASGVASAYACLRKMNNDESLGSDFNVHVHRNPNGSVTITW